MPGGGLCLQQPLKDQLVKTPRPLLPCQGDDVKWQTAQAHVSEKNFPFAGYHPLQQSPHFPARVRRLPCWFDSLWERVRP